MTLQPDTMQAWGRVPLAALALALALAACDRREVEDDSVVTPAEPSVSREAGTPPAGADRAIDAPVATNEPEPMDPGEMAPGATPAGTRSASQADALALLTTVDEHEIAAADQALRKNVTGAVREYAEMMKTEHGRNLADTTKLGAAASTAQAVKALREKGEADLRALDAHAGPAYEKAYIDAMVRGHTEALALIDTTLLPAATDTSIRQHFNTTRATVARHLARAREIQSTLK